MEFDNETQFLENRVSKYGHIPKQFQIWGILRESLAERVILPFWPLFLTITVLHFDKLVVRL